MKKILVFGLGNLSNGEITIAAETLRNGYKKRYDLLFLSHKQGAIYLESMGFPAKSFNSSNPFENKKIFDRLLKDWRPHILLCADTLTMDYATIWSGIDFAYLRGTGLPLGSMDEYEWESTSFSWDYLGSGPLKVKQSLIKECDFLIRPCPLNKPRYNDRRIFACPLFSDPIEAPKYKRTEWCDKLGIPKNKKIIFTVNSSWEYIEVSKSQEIKNLIKWMPQMIHKYLAETKIPLTIIHVGPQKWNFFIERSLEYYHFSKMEGSLYRDGLYHADLFCGTNAISITLSNAVYFQTPSILFQNHKIIDFSVLSEILPKMPNWYQEMAADVKKAGPFRIFPWGWYHFLKPVFKDNPYTKSFITAPIMEPKNAIRLIKKYLTDERSIQQLKEKQYNYFKAIKNLEPFEIYL